MASGSWGRRRSRFLIACPASEAEAVMELAGTPILIAGPSLESDRAAPRRRRP